MHLRRRGSGGADPRVVDDGVGHKLEGGPGQEGIQASEQVGAGAEVLRGGVRREALGDLRAAVRRGEGEDPADAQRGIAELRCGEGAAHDTAHGNADDIELRVPRCDIGPPAADLAARMGEDLIGEAHVGVRDREHVARVAGRGADELAPQRLGHERPGPVAGEHDDGPLEGNRLARHPVKRCRDLFGTALERRFWIAPRGKAGDEMHGRAEREPDGEGGAVGGEHAGGRGIAMDGSGGVGCGRVGCGHDG